MSECSICGKAILYPGTNYGGSPDSICYGHFFPKPPMSPNNLGNIAQSQGFPSQVIGFPAQGISQQESEYRHAAEILIRIAMNGDPWAVEVIEQLLEGD